MSRKENKFRLPRAGFVYPALLLLAGMALSAMVAYFQYRSIDKNARDEFERMSVRTEVEIANRLEKAVHALRGTRGLFEARQHVDRNEFRNYVLSRDLEQEFHGIRGFGYIERVNRSNAEAYTAHERAQGVPDFTIRQLVDKGLQDLFVIKFIEPENQNKGAKGLDVGSESLRRSGIRQAINTGVATVTGAITLVQDEKKQPGVLLYLPIYRKDAPVSNAVERNLAVVGVLYAPIVMNEILEGIPDVVSGMLDFEVVDAPINSKGGTLMFDADNHVSSLPPGAEASMGRRYSLRKPLQLPGRSVTLSMNSTPAFDATINLTFPWLLFGGGAFISMLLTVLLHQLASGRQRAEKLAQDMTQDLQIAMRDNEALLSTLNLHSIVSVADKDGRILEANDAFCQISGYSREELIGRDHRIVNSAVQSREYWADMWKVISSGLPWRGQVCNLAKAGHLYWVDTVIAPFIGNNGVIEKYISIRTDITAIKNAEEELRWSQSLMDKMSNSSPMGYLVVDNRNDEILYFNNRFCEIWGIGHLAERMRRKELKNGDIIPDCLPALADVNSFVESCKPLQSEHNRITLEDEIAFTNQRTVRRFTTQIRDAQGHYYGRFYIFEDVTERKNTELALTRATQAAQAASLAKSQFLANMSHEIRTPMNAILGMLTLLRKTELTPRQEDYAAKSDGAARSLLGLLNEILDFSKIEAGKMALDPHPFAVDQLLRDLSVILSTNVGEKSVEVLFDIDPTLPRELVGDAMRIKQVLLNLGSNAVKFTEKGEVVLSIKVLMRTADVVTLQFAMQDSGIGIAPENQARIFSGFTQAESSTTRRFGGTGLGVVISQRFVSLMGGELELQSEVGRGSRFFFTITLPVAPTSVALEQERARIRAVSAAWHTLVIDDNALAREILAHMGQTLGWQVDLAENGEQGLQMFEAQCQGDQPYQVVLVDWDMPGMDGWAVARNLRGIVETEYVGKAEDQRPLVIMVTSHGRDMLSQRSPQEQALFDGFVVKPVTASMLFDVVIDARVSKDQPHPSRAPARKSQRRLEGIRVLLVEDNLNNQQVASELLADEGALVQIANHGKEAVETIAAAGPMLDVVLMDLQMPVMDGFAATKVIRHDLGFKQLPIVAMTANALASDREACLAVGMNDHVGKPFDLNDLVRVLRRQTKRDEDLPEVETPTLSLPDEAKQVAIDAGIDLTAALHRLGGKHDVYRRTLQTFLQDLQALPRQLAEANAPEAKGLLHTLKGLAATLGAGALSADAAAAEKIAATHPADADLQGAIARVRQAIADSLPGLQAMLAALQTDAQDSASSAPALDRAALVAALGTMAEQLENDDMESMTAMSSLMMEYGDALGDELTALEKAMADMEFAQALPLCRALMNKYSA